MTRLHRLTGPALAATAAVLLAATAACGGGKGAGSGSGNTGGGDSGASGGGSGSGGSGSGSGGGTASGGGSGGGDAGGTASGGGSGSGGTGSGSGGGTSDACAGLTAAPDAGRAFRFADSRLNVGCNTATTSPGGQVALGILEVGRGLGTATFFLYPPDGSARQGSIVIGGHPGADLDPWFHATGGGWAGLGGVADFSATPFPPDGLVSFDAAGNELRRTRDEVNTTAPDGHGGTDALMQPAVGQGQQETFGPAELAWFDASGSVVRTAPLDANAGALLVEWATGHVLVLGGSSGAPKARWYDGTGAPLTPWFDGVATPYQPTMHLLVDGSIALGDEQAWRGVFRDGVAAVDSPPAWLAARPGTRLATIRGGNGYAALPFRNGATGKADQTTVELLTAAGASCGKLTVPAAPAEPGIARTPEGIEVGQDGTLLEWEYLSGAPLGDGNHCEFRWWPALLR